jgi:hypothetical protein
VFEGCKIGQKPAMGVTVERVFAILYKKCEWRKVNCEWSIVNGPCKWKIAYTEVHSLFTITIDL